MFSHMSLLALPRLARTTAIVVTIALLHACGLFGSSWLGTWNVTDTQGGRYTITLMEDGKATAHGSQNAFGMWSEEDGPAYIVWNTGWKAILFFDSESGKHMKSAFSVDEGFMDAPITTTPARKR